MKLTKTVLAVAIAGIAAAPMMASATTKLSGAVQLKFTGSDSKAADTNRNGDVTEAGEAEIASGDVMFSINTEQALNNGLTGYGSLRLAMHSLSGDKEQTDDEVYVGVKGGFGDLRIGEVGNPGEYGQFSDILNDMGAGINEGISYTGTFGGATVGVAYSPSTNQDIIGAGAKFAYNGLSIGVGMQDFDEKTNLSASVGFSYAGASIHVGGAQLEDGAGSEDETVIRAKVGYGIGDVSLGFIYEGEQKSEDTKVRLSAGYDLGGGMGLAAEVNAFTAGLAGDDKTDWKLQVSKSF